MTLWVWASLAWAGEVPVDLDQAIARAWENAVGKAVGEARVAVARAAVRGEKAPEDPQIRVRAEDVGSAVDPIQWTFRVRQDLAAPGELRSAGRAAAAQVAVEEADAAVAREELRWETTEIFDQLRVALAAEGIANDEVVLVRQRLDLANRRLSAGLPVASDVLDAEIAVLGAVRRAREATLERVTLEGLLAAVLGLEPGDLPVPQGPPLDEVAMAEIAPSEADGALVRLAQAEAEASDAEARAESAARRPFLTWLEAGVEVRSDRVPSLILGGAFDVPLFTLTDGVVRLVQAEAAEHRAEALAEARVQARTRLAATRRLQAAQEGVIAIREALAVASARLTELGLSVTPDRKVDFEVELVQERRRLLDVVAEAIVARRVLEG